MTEQLTHGAAGDRRRQLLALVRRDGFAGVTALSQALGVSQMTVRRDLRRLADEDVVRLVHGGATVARTPGEVAPRPEEATAHASVEPELLAYTEREDSARDAKARIGKAAAALVERGATIGVDAGTTALEVARHLPRRFDGVVVSHSIPVLTLMLERLNVRVIGVGGELLHASRAMVGAQTADQVRGLRLRLLVLGAGAVDGDGIYVHSQVELQAKRALVDVAEKVVLVADSRKLSASAPVRVCGFDRIDAWVVERPLPTVLAEAARRNGSRVVIA